MLLQGGYSFMCKDCRVLAAGIHQLQLLQGHVPDIARTSGGSVQGSIMDHHLRDIWDIWAVASEIGFPAASCSAT